MTQVSLFVAFLVVLLYFSIIAAIAFLEFYAVETMWRMEDLSGSKQARQKKITT